jgi:hypothetical protein
MSSAPDTAGARTGPVRRPAANELGRVLADFKRGCAPSAKKSAAGTGRRRATSMRRSTLLFRLARTAPLAVVDP